MFKFRHSVPPPEMGPPGSEEGCTEHLYCGGAATEVLKFGARDLHPASKLHSTPRVVFLLIPGNPGVVGFYRTFLQTVHQAFGRRHPVWAVSHAGHCAPPGSMRMTTAGSPGMQIEDVFGLNGQVEHKLAFLREHVPREAKLVLIGHSIGCYIIIEMMKRDPELQVLKSVLLFPTIERMAVTPQGRVMTPVLRQLRYVAYLPVFLLSLLPQSLQATVVKVALRAVRCLDLSVIPAALSLFNVDCAANAMYMGSQEMVQVLGRDDSTIRQNLDKLIFYYGATDSWCPVQYYQDVRADFPRGNIRLCGKGYRHAFVLDAGAEVAAMVTEWVRQDVENS
ncbi:lipid droplet-associated hydrolase isoform X2 [Anguilla rostrata]|uniref:lipid droplet-associated hydrolase isoform X2 n=1 Tax=Anguilla rostrata TaxID=7938 RepID=UPI0030CC942F